MSNTKNAIGSYKKEGVAGMAVLLLVVLSGCAGTTNQAGPINPILPIGLPPAPPPASSNAFTGTQGPGLWYLSIDDTQSQFTYQSLTYPASPNTPTSGPFLNTFGFLSLTNPNGTAGGYAVEVPGRAVWLEPQNDTVAPVFAVEQDSCFAINWNVKFNFVAVPNQFATVAQTDGSYPAYGSISTQTSADGSSWRFGSQAQYLRPFTIYPPGFLPNPTPPGTVLANPETYLTTFPGACSVANGQATIAAAPDVSSLSPVSTLPTNFVVGPTGFFFEDQSTGKQTGANNVDAASFVGVAEPSSPLTTSSIAVAKYVGFMREAGRSQLGAITSTTQPIGFGQLVAGPGTSLTGGTFLNDDITQFQSSNIVINLGTQDATNNGLYPLASVTIADPTNVCFYDPPTNHNGVGGLPGVDAFGNATCTFNAVAVIGNPENRYAIFINSYDAVNKVPMGIYLFQQQ